MLSSAALRWGSRAGALAALLVLVGCSSSKPYTLVAQLPPLPQTHILTATVDVDDGACTVRFLRVDAPLWTPPCSIVKDQPTYKSFLIAGQEVDFGAIDNGFKVLSATLPALPSSTTAAAPVAATGKAAAAAPTPAPAAATGAAAASTDVFPQQWNLSPYPGHVQLQGQNLGFMVKSASLTINGSQATLDVTYKVPTYGPLHVLCTVVSNQHGDFNLTFNPLHTGGGNYAVQLTSEGQSISGNIWDSHGFDSWTPSLPPQWVAVSYSSD